MTFMPCHYYFCLRQVPKENISLKLFSNQGFLVDYFAFVWARSTKPGSITKDVYKAQRVVDWLKAKDADTPEKHAHLDRVARLLTTLSKKFMEEFPHGKLSEGMAAPPVLPSKESIFDFQARFREEVLDALLAMEDGRATRDHYNLLADYTLAEFLSNNIPPTRLSCVRTMAAPTSATGSDFKCTDPDCSVRGCKGNRLEVVPGQCYHDRQDRVSLRPTPRGLNAWTVLEGYAAGPPAAPQNEQEPDVGQAPSKAREVKWIAGVGLAHQRPTTGGGTHLR